MLVKYGKMEKPKQIVIDEASATSTFARFIAQPFERVFGHTIGNALRRILLSSLETPGIISVRIEGVPHEFMAIEGVVEDMTTIILNLKGALLRHLPADDQVDSRQPRLLTNILDISQEDLDSNKGQIIVTLDDIVPEGSIFEVVNPNLPLFTVTKPMKRQIDLRVAYGRGYVPSERHVIPNRLLDEIIIDTAFSPVRLVNYYVENTRVGQDTDYDSLIMEVTTDGRISPAEALAFAAQIATSNFEVFNHVNDAILNFEDSSLEKVGDQDDLLDKLLLRIEEIELSVRSTNCLAGANIETIAELVSIPEKKMLEFRNFGKKSLNEIKAKLSEMNLSLGMDLSRFGISMDNVKEKVKELMEQRRGRREAALKVEE